MPRNTPDLTLNGLDSNKRQKNSCVSCICIVFKPQNALCLLTIGGILLSYLNMILVRTYQVESVQNPPDLWKSFVETNERPAFVVQNASLTDNAIFSACLLVKDDNAIFNEWIAYHYHVLKLRRLIVAVDPASTESPAALLQQWQQLTELRVTLWKDEDYLPGLFLLTKLPPEEYRLTQTEFDVNMTEDAMRIISAHRYRQRVFLAQCMKSLKQQNHSWMIHIDTDEYVVSSKALRRTSHYHVNILELDQPGAVLHLLQQVVRNTSDLVNYPCIGMLRVFFGSYEPKKRGERTNLYAPGAFNISRFETLRWVYHGHPQDTSLQRFPKVILDLAAIPQKYFPDVAFSVHRPIQEFCLRKRQLGPNMVLRQPIALNHYLGDWERYSSRNDIRRSREKYTALSRQDCCKDNYAQNWLVGFVDHVGMETASKLLHDYLTLED